MGYLEIITADGVVQFYQLDPSVGLTNIGYHPGSDIVLPGAEATLFQAVLYHRSDRWELVLISNRGEVRMNGQPVSGQQPVPVENLSRLELDGYTLVFFPDRARPADKSDFPVEVPASGPVERTQEAGTEATAAAPAQPARTATQLTTPSRPPVFVPPPESPGAPTAGAFPPPEPPEAEARFAAPVADQPDEYIITELSPTEMVIDVEQTATYHLTIINGGDLVATFQVRVEGLDDQWVKVTPARVNLYEGNRAEVVITVTPPRSPYSTAGPHYFAVTTTSMNYPGRRARCGAVLVINPFYEFRVGEVTPREQTISWVKRSAQVTFPITNQGNSRALFQVDGRDDERGCTFEFQPPGEEVIVANQAEFRIPPNETVTLPVIITPHQRQLVALRKRVYHFSVTATMPEGGQAPRSMLGRLKAAPLLGPGLLAVLALLMLVLIVYIFKPRIYTFNVDGSVKKVLVAGQSATLSWKASPFTRLEIPELGPEPLNKPQGQVTVVPTANAIYHLEADNWLSRLNPTWFGEEPRQVSIILTPIPPKIVVFGGDKQAVVTGDRVLLSWQVENADTVNLINQADGNPKPLPGVSGSLEVGPLDRETTYYLEADNPYIATPVRSDPFIIKVATPTPTPLPTPAVVKFFANPPAIVAGENTTLEWEVRGADRVSVLGIGDGLPPVQSVVQSPAQTTNYVLNASNGSSAAPPQSLTVWVTPAPTPTPEPDAPVIKFFTADPTDLILLKGSAGQVELAWSIEGKTTNIEVSGPSLNSPIVGLSPSGTLNLTVQESTLFVLTAENEGKKSNATVNISVNEPTPTPTATPTLTPPPPTATPIPPAVINRFIISSPGSPQVIDLGGDTPHRYQVRENTDVLFAWEVNLAAKITFIPDAGSSVEVNPSGQTAQRITVPNVGVVRNYLLVAENSISQRTTASIEVTVVDPPPPDPPHTVTGVEKPSDNQNIISWQWTADPNKDTIIGFRVYRANIPGGAYSLIPGADENSLTADAPKQFTDTVS
ncbi:MAG: hypothetical protein D6784_15385, partial [Chloroflexi bacterium]